MRKDFRFVELKDLYDLFVDTTFCENQYVIVRMHVYEDYDAYEEYDDPNKAIYYQSCECDSFYLSDETREEKLKKYDAEIECCYISLVTSDTIYIDCEYVKYNKEC